MRYRMTVALAAAAAMMVGAPGSPAQDKKAEKKEAPKKVSLASLKRPEFPKFEDVVKGLTVVGGYYTLYHKGAKMLAEVPASALKKPFLMATSIARGNLAGWQWDDQLLTWERDDKRLLLISPDVRHTTSKSSDRVADSVRRNYTDTILVAAPILTKSPKGGLLIDLYGLLTGKASLFVGPLAGRLNPYLSRVHKVKNFPLNTEIEIDMASRSRSRFGFFGFGAGGGNITTVHYSISQLPVRPTYKPRTADDRIGYFLTAVKDYTDDSRKDTRFVRYINRWKLEKDDPSLKLSPAKEPIIFYVENSVPVRYRRAVMDGIREWNKAYERIGIVNAIVVRGQWEDATFKDRDPEDVRYNFFRWITSDMAFAMGPSRVDPRTGQILDADIIFDDAMLRYFLQEHKFYVTSNMRSRLNPRDERFLQAHPKLDPLRFERQVLPEEVARGMEELRKNPRLDRFEGTGRKMCSLGVGIVHQMAMAQLAVLAADSEKNETWPDNFLYEVVKETVMHEVGHTLGLRHNFKGSSWLGYEKYNTKENPPDATSGSVMDYNPMNVAPKGTPQGRYAPVTLGPYDYWAIEYGYHPAAKAKDLAKTASRVAEEGLAYGTDEDVWQGSDPLINRWDSGRDPLVFAETRMKLVAQIQKDLVARAVGKGESYEKARRAFLTLLYERFNAEWVAAIQVGGNHMHRDHRGDPKARPPVVPVDVKNQRRGIEFIARHVFADEAWRFSPELLNHLGADRWWHWGSAPGMVDFPIHAYISMLQSWALFDLLNPWTLQRVFDGEWRVPRDQDALTIPEVIRSVTKATCGEFWTARSDGKRHTDRNPLVSSVRRNLQREYVEWLVMILLDSASSRSWYPSAAHSLARYELKQLGDRLAAAKKTGLDTYTAAHFDELAARIDKALKASVRLGAGGGSYQGG